VVWLPKSQILLAVFGFHHRLDGTANFGNANIAIRSEIELGLKAGHKPTIKESEKMNMPTQFAEKDKKPNWKLLTGLAVLMVPLLRRASIGS
jgi:hypothetical protein